MNVSSGKPRQRLVDEDEHRRRGERHRAEQERLVRLQRRGRDHDRPEQQDGERVLQPAGQVEQAGKLQEVVGEKQRRPVRVEPMRRREGERRPRLSQAESEISAKQAPNGSGKPNHSADDQDRRRLAADGEPAQPDQRREPEPAAGPAAGFARPCRRSVASMPAVLAASARAVSGSARRVRFRCRSAAQLL